MGENNKPQLSIILADDHAIIREGIKSILSRHYNLDVAGEAENGHEALELIRNKISDLVFLDLSMPRMRGLDVIQTVRQEKIATRIIILTMHKERLLFRRAIGMGVSGYLLKDDTIPYLHPAVEAVLSGKSYYSPEIEKMIFEDYASMQREKGPLEIFTRKELTVLKLVATGMTSKQISDELNVSIRTVEFHRGNINKKLNTSRVSEQTQYALSNGLI